MAILKKVDQPYRRIQIDLTGSDGNTIVLLGYARRWARELGIDFDPIQKQCLESEYEEIIQILDKHFGAFVDFIR